MKSRYTLFIVLGLGLIGVMVIGTLLTRKSYQFKGSIISPVAPAADFALLMPDRATFRLSEARGQVVLIFFGYTHCPDECPMTLAEFRQIIRRLGARSQEVTFLLITVDPEEDTPQVLGEYTAQFDPSIIGLTGDLPVLEQVWQAYGVIREADESNEATDPMVAHTSLIYGIDKRGNLRLTYPFGFETESILQDIEHLLDER